MSTRVLSGATDTICRGAHVRLMLRARGGRVTAQPVVVPRMSIYGYVALLRAQTHPVRNRRVHRWRAHHRRSPRRQRWGVRQRVLCTDSREWRSVRTDFGVSGTRRRAWSRRERIRVAHPPREVHVRRRAGGTHRKNWRSRARWRARAPVRARTQHLLRLLLMYSVAQTRVAAAADPPAPSTHATCAELVQCDLQMRFLCARRRCVHAGRPGSVRPTRSPPEDAARHATRDPAAESAWVRDLTEDGDIESHPGPSAARPIAMLAWNVNGIHVRSRKGVGDHTDEDLGDGEDPVRDVRSRSPRRLRA